MIRTLVRLHSALARLAPSSSRALADDARATFRAVSRAAYDRRGVRGLFVVSVREFVDLIGAIVREHREVRRDARRSSGSPDRVSLAAATRDFRLAVRALRSARAASLLAALTLALGIGTTAAAFSVLDSVLLRQIPFPHADRLVEIATFNLDRKMSFLTGMPPAGLNAWRAQSDLFDRVEGFAPRSFVLDREGGAEQLIGAFVTPGLPDLLGASPALGRTFLPDDGDPGARPVALVSAAFWSTHLGRRPNLTGSTLTLDGSRYDVVGVLPHAFRFPNGAAQVWVTGPSESLIPLARLAVAIDYDAAAAEVTARGERLGMSVGGPARVSATLTRQADGVSARTETTLLVLTAAVGFLFLIVCVNVANLTLSRALGRARDLTTCAALGASRASLFRVVFLEQSALAAIGVALGAGVAALVLQIALAVLPDVMTNGTLNAIDLDARALWVLVATGVGTMLLCGLPPAWIAARASVTAGWSHGGRTTAGSRFARLLRTGLAIAEVAVSVALLVGAALTTRSFVALAAEDHGYTPTGLISVRLGLPAAGYPDATVANSAMRDVVARIQALPGVIGATIGGLPSERDLIAIGTFDGAGPPAAGGPRAMVPIHEVSESYFDVVRLPIRLGRGFQPGEPAGAAIVNERFAATHFPGGEVVGQRFRIGNGQWRTIVGVAGDTLGDRESGSRGQELYYPLGQATDAARPVRHSSSIKRFYSLLVRSDNAAAVVPLLSGAVHDRDPSIVVWQTALVERMLAEDIARPRVVFATMAVFAGSGLVLAMVGVYGVLTHLVTQRRHEIGVRMALGADPVDIRRLVLRHSLTLTAAGVVFGLCASWPMVRLMRSLLHEVAAADPLALAGSVVLVLLTAALASWAPARRAGRTNPVELFRGD